MAHWVLRAYNCYYGQACIETKQWWLVQWRCSSFPLLSFSSAFFSSCSWWEGEGGRGGGGRGQPLRPSGRASTLKASGTGLNPVLPTGLFSVQVIPVGHLEATLPGVWPYRVRARTGPSSVWILSLDETGFIYNFYLSVAEHTVVLADPSLRHTNVLQGC